MPKGKEKNFFKVAKAKMSALYGDGGLNKGIVRSPTDAWNAMTGKIAGGGHRAGGEDHSTAECVGRMVRSRVINGPELNIVLAGIPFLIDTAVETIKRNVGPDKGTGTPTAPTGGRAAHTGYGGSGPKLKLRPTADQQSALSSATQEDPEERRPKAPPVPSAPHSHHMVPVQSALIQMGMSPEGATDLVAGKYHGRDVKEHISSADHDVLTGWLVNCATPSAPPAPSAAPSESST